MMTAKEARAAFDELGRSISPSAEIYISFNNAGADTPALNCSVYPSGMIKEGLSFRVTGDDWDELLAAAHAKWAEHRGRHRAQMIRKMALDIIRITAMLGECTDAALRPIYRPFEIDAFGALACADADQIAGKGPFAIKTTVGANSDGAPEDGET